MVGAGLAILSVVETYWIFLAVFIGMVALGNNTSFGQTFLAVINRWFIKRKAVAMTLVITSYTIGGAIMVPLLSRGIEALGWRAVLNYAPISPQVREGIRVRNIDPVLSLQSMTYYLTDNSVE